MIGEPTQGPRCKLVAIFMTYTLATGDGGVNPCHYPKNACQDLHVISWLGQGPTHVSMSLCMVGSWYILLLHVSVHVGNGAEMYLNRIELGATESSWSANLFFNQKPALN